MSTARDVLIPYVATRVLTAGVALLAVALFPYAAVCTELCHLSTNPLLDAASRWDAFSYLDIARNGYATDRPSHMAFFPLYPFLMRVLGAPFGGTDDAYLAAGVVISNGALAVAVLYLARLVAIDHDARAGSRAALYLLVFPASVFLAAVYAESLFLALAIAAIYHARRGDWLLAGALAGLAALAKPFGAIVALPLAIEALRRGAGMGMLAAVAVAPAAFFAWIAVLWRITGDPLALLTAQASWGTRPSLPIQAFADLGDPNVYGFPFLVIATTFLIGALTVLGWRVLAPSLAAYATAVFLVGISTGTLTSAPRYYLMVFPAFMVLAIAAPAWLARGYVALGTGIGVILTAMFALHYWVA